MEKYDRDILKNLRRDIEDLLPEDEFILKSYEILYLDNNEIIDVFTTILHLSASKLIISYDESIEIYDLNNLEISIYGDNPRFNYWQILTEGNYEIGLNPKELIFKLQQSEFQTKVVLNEPKRVPFEIMLRTSFKVGKSYQNWALAQQLVNLKHGLDYDNQLESMMKGPFQEFSVILSIFFATSFIVYLALRMLAMRFLPDLISVILDGIFGIIILYCLYWIYTAIKANYEKFQEVYNRYYK